MFFFLWVLLLEIPHLKGQQKIEEFQQFALRLTFPSFYNSYEKSCCKLYPGGCYKLLDSTGFTCDLLKGRVVIREDDGWMEFEISNVRFVDGGYYRCMVLGTENRVYTDYYVEVSEVLDHHIQSQPPLATTTKSPNISTLFPASTGAVLEEDRRDSPRVSWNFGLPVTVIGSITVMVLITSVIGVIFCRVKTKQSDKYGETLNESLKQEAPEMSGIVYTTVDFKAHQKPTHGNLRMHKTQGGDSNWNTEHHGMVEYSVLAVHH